MTTIQERFLWAAFARVNPALPPRRRKATAERWAKCAAHLSAYLRGKDHHEKWPALCRWAALFQLEAGRNMPLPDDYTPLGDGSLRQYANDQGGIEGSLLSTLSRIVLCGTEAPTDIQWTAWKILFPGTANLGNRYSRSAELESSYYSAVLSEWELSLDDAAYHVQMHGDGRNLHLRFNLSPSPVHDDTFDVDFAGVNWLAWLSVDGYVELSEPSKPVDPTTFWDAVYTLTEEVGQLAVAVNNHPDYCSSPWRAIGVVVTPEGV